jgi:hypothetical protein
MTRPMWSAVPYAGSLQSGPLYRSGDPLKLVWRHVERFGTIENLTRIATARNVNAALGASMTRTFRYIAAVVLFLSACICACKTKAPSSSGRDMPCEAANEQAKRDLDCPTMDGLCFVTMAGRAIHVGGCGKQAVYACRNMAPEAGVAEYRCTGGAVSENRAPTP